MKKAVLHILLILVAGISYCLNNVAWGQTVRLVSWEGYRDNWSSPTNNPSYYNNSDNYVTAGNLSGNNVNLTTTYERFQGDGNNGWPTASSPDYNKYIQISISAKEGYQINLYKLKFKQSGYCDAYEIRFSKNPNFPSNGTLLSQNTNASATYNQNTEVNFPTNTIVNPEETLYVRFYGYKKNQYNHPWGLNNSPYNLQTESSNEAGPAFYGEVSVANLAPEATNDNASTAQNTPVSINILDNDTYSSLSAITITQQPAHGQNITVNGLNNVTYTPNNNYTGTDNFKYTITDETGTSNEATVNITVTAPTAPTAVADTVSVTLNQAKNINILANDIPGSGAFNNITIISNPTHGTATVNADNTITYTPNTNYTGTDNLQYNVTSMDNMTSNTILVSMNVAAYNPCANCTNTIPNGGGDINVGAGQIYCLTSGTFTGRFSLAAGGTICIASGATFTPSEAPLGSVFNGTIINNGTMAFPLYNGGTYTATIENHGTFTSPTLQNFAGTIQNYGTITVNGGLDTKNGCAIHNYGTMNIATISFYGTTVNNYTAAQFTVTNGVNVYSGYWNNQTGSTLYLKGGNVNFTGDLDNSGYWEFERISSLSSTLNNYGRMKVYNAANNISSTTYLTNDSLLEFINVSQIQYNGPMLTNNGRLVTSGLFKMNQAINQLYNNGIIITGGQFEQNAAGSKLVNNCRIVCKTFFVGNGDATNNGLIWALGTGNSDDDIKIHGNSSTLKNGKTAQVRGINFVNTGHITGYGSFYFTGNTNANSSGTIIGNSADTPIFFYDASQTGSNIFDNPPQNTSLIQNVLRPGSMTPMDTTSFDCSAIPVSGAGFLPNTDTVSRTYCTPPASLNFDLHNYVSAYDNTCTIQWSTIKLFEYNNPDNTTNNTTNLIIANKGVFSANTTTGIITFTPDSAFTSGSVTAQYRIANTKAGDPIVYPSLKTDIMITRSCNNDYTPATSTIDTTFCGADSVLLNMNNYINAHAPVDGFSFSLQWNTLKLFDPANPGNPGNGTDSIHIADTGTFTITQTNPGQITFYPETGFTGTATAQYQITNIWSKNNETFTSDKTAISAHGSNIPAPNIQTPHTF